MSPSEHLGVLAKRPSLEHRSNHFGKITGLKVAFEISPSNANGEPQHKLPLVCNYTPTPLGREEVTAPMATSNWVRLQTVCCFCFTKASYILMYSTYVHINMDSRLNAVLK